MKKFLACLTALAAKINALRPWQLAALFVMTQILLALLCLLLPTWREQIGIVVFKTWEVCGFACLGLLADMVINYRSRPGDTNDPAERARREERRSRYVVGSMLAGGLAL